MAQQQPAPSKADSDLYRALCMFAAGAELADAAKAAGLTEEEFTAEIMKG